jgi:hypothetical protein
MQTYLFGVTRPEGRDVVMPWGKHKGERLGAIDVRYLEWLLTRDWLRAWLAEAVRDELGCRKAALARARQEWVEQVPDDLPSARPCEVAGIKLDATEAALFAQAVAVGELVVTPDLPVGSPVEAAWRRWCEQGGRPCRVREVRGPANDLPAGVLSGDRRRAGAQDRGGLRLCLPRPARPPARRGDALQLDRRRHPLAAQARHLLFP